MVQPCIIISCYDTQDETNRALRGTFDMNLESGDEADEVIRLWILVP